MKRLIVLAAIVFAALGLAGIAAADTVGPITFESPQYAVGNINGQQNWSNTGGYDANVALVSTFPAASAYGSFYAQALQISNSKTSGSFGDQQDTLRAAHALRARGPRSNDWAPPLTALSTLPRSPRRSPGARAGPLQQ